MSENWHTQSFLNSRKLVRGQKKRRKKKEKKRRKAATVEQVSYYSRCLYQHSLANLQYSIVIVVSFSLAPLLACFVDFNGNHVLVLYKYKWYMVCLVVQARPFVLLTREA